MIDLKHKLIAQLIMREGGYSNHPNDTGGKTRYGITEKVARNYGYNGSIKMLPYELAFSIYRQRYWDTLKLDDIANIEPELAKQLFDFGVHSGIATAAKTLQQLLNVFNMQQLQYPDLKTDGVIGNQTVNALVAFSDHRKQKGLLVLCEAVRGKRISFCVNIALKNQTQERYAFGWLARIVNL